MLIWTYEKYIILISLISQYEPDKRTYKNPIYNLAGNKHVKVVGKNNIDMTHQYFQAHACLAFL